MGRLGSGVQVSAIVQIFTVTAWGNCLGGGAVRGGHMSFIHLYYPRGHHTVAVLVAEWLPQDVPGGVE